MTPIPATRRFPPALAAALLLLAPAAAPAATALRLDLPALVAASDLVVRGVVRSSTPRREASGRIVTDHLLQVDEVLAGPAGDTVVVTTPGGEVEDEGQRVPGAPLLAPGDEVVLFLRRPGPASPLARTAVAGLSQGLLRVLRDGAGAPRLFQDLSGLRLVGEDAGPLPVALPHLRDALRGLPPPGVSP